MVGRISLALDDTSSAFVEAEIAAGRFSSASDVVGASLRLLQAQRARLLEALDEGEASGVPVAFDVEAFIAGKRGA